MDSEVNVVLVTVNVHYMIHTDPTKPSYSDLTLLLLLLLLLKTAALAQVGKTKKIQNCFHNPANSGIKEN